MSTQTILLVVLIVLLLGGGSYPMVSCTLLSMTPAAIA
jgi:hypothetical protein